MMSVSKWVLSALFVSIFSQMSYAGDGPVSITPVLVPSDATCRACRMGEPLSEQGLVNLVPSDETCRKCAAMNSDVGQTARLSFDRCLANDAKIYDESMSVIRMIDECNSTPSEGKRRSFKEKMALAKNLAYFTAVDCRATLAFQVQADKQSRLISVAESADAVEKTLNNLEEIYLTRNPNFCK